MQRSVMWLVLASFAAASAAATAQQSQTASVEDIYIARSLRQSRGAATSYCAEARVGFAGATFEDQYTFEAVATRISDGKVTDANAGTIGRLHACLGQLADSTLSGFYAE